MIYGPPIDVESIIHTLIERAIRDKAVAPIELAVLYAAMPLRVRAPVTYKSE